MAGQQYKVVSYFINVGVGDGAIHLLLKNNQVSKAVLIDGGEVEASACTAFTIAALRQKYHGSFTGFDAIAITHWDGDHFRGTLKMLYEDIAQNGQTSYIKQTTKLYAPATAFNKVQAEEKFRRVKVTNVEHQYELQIKTPNHQDWQRLCEFVISTYCIGYDLFSGIPLSGHHGTPKLVDSLGDVYTASTILQGGTPIFLCIGCEDFFIDWPDIEPTFNDNEINKLARTKKNMNASSLMLISIWPKASPTDPPRINLYTAGDAEEEQEMPFIEWIKDPNAVIDVIKPGHHGSAKATPERLLDYQTKIFLISAGGRHGHPTMSLLFFLMSYIYHKFPDYEPHVFATCYPYWMNKPQALYNDVDVNLENVLSYKKGAYQIKAVVQKLTGINYGDVWFKDAIQHLKNVYNYAYTTQELMNLDKTTFPDVVDEHNKPIRGPLSDALILPRSELHTVEDESELAVFRIVDVMRGVWDIHGSPHREALEGDQETRVGMIQVTANYETTWAEPKYVNVDFVVQMQKSSFTITDSNFVRSLLPADHPNAFTNLHGKLASVATNATALGKFKMAKEAKQHSLLNPTSIPIMLMDGSDTAAHARAIVAPKELNSEPLLAEEWIKSFFVDDLNALAPLPPTLIDFPLARQTSNTAVWFSSCLGGAVTAKISGSALSSGIVLQTITMQVNQRDNSGTPIPSILEFSSDATVIKAQFGSEIVPSSNGTVPAFDARLQGMILGLKTAPKISLLDFANLFDFHINPWVASMVGSVSLVPKDQLGRSGVWFIPGEKLKTYLRLEMTPDLTSPGTMDIQNFLSQSLGEIIISNITVRGTRSQETLAVGYAVKDTSGTFKSKIKKVSSLSLEANFEYVAEDSPFDVSARLGITFTDTGFEVKIKMLRDPEILKKAISWIQRRVSGKDDTESPDSAKQKILDMIGNDDFYFHYASLGFSEQRLISCKLFMEITMHSGPEDKNVPLMVTLSWSAGIFMLTGELYDDKVYGSLPAALNPLRESIDEIQPFTPNWNHAISIPRVLKLDKMTFPAGIPSLITSARVCLSTGHGATKISIEGAVQPSPPTNQASLSNVPTLWFQELYLFLSADIGAGKTFMMRFRGSLEIKASPGQDYEDSAIHLNAAVEYIKDMNTSYWTASAEVSNVHIGQLYGLFAQDGANDAIMDVMSKIVIMQASVTFKYETEHPSDLTIDGILSLDTAELKLMYKHDSNGWAFNATLQESSSVKSKKQNPTLGSILSKFLHETETLPSFVMGLTVPLDKSQLELGCKSISGEDADKSPIKYLVFSIKITIDKFVAIFAQIRPYGHAVKPQVKPTPGRLLRFVLSGIPGMDNIPVLGDMKMPLDQLGIVWTNRDITNEEVDVLNNLAFPAELPIITEREHNNGKEPEKETKSVLLAAGCHFQIALKQENVTKLILDYVPGKKKRTRPKALFQNIKDTPKSLNEDHPETAMVPMSKSIGPLSIRNFGLRVDNGKKVIVILDASVRLGPVTFALLGFSISIDLSLAETFDGLLRVVPEANIQGMAVSFEKPPTRLAGMFARFEAKDMLNQDVHGYKGAIVVALGAWSAMAAGAYEEHTDFKSLFVFGFLKGPIAQFGYAEINGVTGGFGYNSQLTLPNVTEVMDYPFIAINTNRIPAKTNLIANLTDLTGGESSTGPNYITAVKDSMWFAAGVAIKAFQILDVNAILCLELSAEPKFGIVASATAIFPRKLAIDSVAADPFEHAFLVLDFGMVATVDPTHGLVLAAGQLTPLSFILSRSCKLTGGFALATFLPGNEHEGDFVFTIGGYHPAYQPPKHYPPAPPRVGISWEYDSGMRILGEAYFAITPQCAMGGGRLDVIIDRGWVTASFSAYANFYLHFHPFFFDIQIGINFYAAVTLGSGILSLHLGPLEFSATLMLHGPPVAGQATLHMWRWDITVVFGPPPSPPPALKLSEFVLMIKNQNPEDKETKPDFMFSIIKGTVAPDSADEPLSSDPTKAIDVRGADFQFMIETRFPITNATVNNQTAKPFTTNEKPSDVTSPIYSIPMQKRDAMTSSVLTVTLTRDGEAVSEFMRGIKLTEQPIIKQLPPGLWGQLKDNPTDQTTQPSIPHVMGYSLSLVRAEPSTEKFPVFDAIAFSKEDGEDNSNHPATIPLPEQPRSTQGFVRQTSELKLSPHDAKEKKEARGIALKDMWSALRESKIAYFKTKYADDRKKAEGIGHPALFEGLPVIPVDL